ncbi:hypothetical protein ACIHQR_08830 [Corallococcus coralloides]|uniref:hypothetical protein n=1 Tax=Corallococcus coralloides TaxID=184914 RepID=UPI003850F727
MKPGAVGPEGRGGGAEAVVTAPAGPAGPAAGRGGGADGATGVDGRGVGERPLGRGAGATPGVGRGAGVARGAPSALGGTTGAEGAIGVGRGVGLGVGEGVGAVEDGVTGPPGVEPGLRMTSTAGSTRRVFLSFTVVRYLMRGARACPGSRLGGC